MPDNTADTPISSVLGFDYGRKRIGLATGQTITGSATPLITLEQRDGNPDWPAIKKQIVLILSLSMASACCELSASLTSNTGSLKRTAGNITRDCRPLPAETI